MTRKLLMKLYMTIVMPLLLLPVIPIAHNILPTDGIKCEAITCNPASPSSKFCPPWHFCDSHTRVCSSCGRCKEAVDNTRPTVRNCQYPTKCVNNYDPVSYDSCPRLKVKEGHRCDGKCTPCYGSFGYSLGTNCVVRCDDGDSEVFSCIFINDLAQWNVSRKPPWIEYEQLPSRPYPLGVETTTRSSQIGNRRTTIQVIDPGTTALVSVLVIIVIGVVASVGAIFLRRHICKNTCKKVCKKESELTPESVELRRLTTPEPAAPEPNGPFPPSGETVAPAGEIISTTPIKRAVEDEEPSTVLSSSIDCLHPLWEDTHLKTTVETSAPLTSCCEYEEDLTDPREAASTHGPVEHSDWSTPHSDLHSSSISLHSDRGEFDLTRPFLQTELLINFHKDVVTRTRNNRHNTEKEETQRKCVEL